MVTLKDIQRHVGVTADGIWGPATAAAIACALGMGTARRTLANAEAFFAGLRKVTGPLAQIQVEVVNRLLADAAHWPAGWLAYGLATAWHEARLKPIEEWGKGKGRDYGKVNSTGKAPYGRGLVQLTWHANYETMDTALGLGGRLAKNYDLALDPAIASRILVVGMERGLFTGKSLATYLPAELGTLSEFRAARRIINGTDRADLIASYADKIQMALIAGEWK